MKNLTLNLEGRTYRFKDDLIEVTWTEETYEWIENHIRKIASENDLRVLEIIHEEDEYGEATITSALVEELFPNETNDNAFLHI